MSEYPGAQPSTDIDWAESGTASEPTAPKKLTGWILNEAPPFDFFNWSQREYARHINHAEAIQQRAFDNLPEAIAATAALDRFYLRHAPQAWTDAAQDKATKHGTGFAVTHIACDGLRLYYVQNGELIATPCKPGIVDTTWAVDLNAQGITGAVQSIDTDGAIVAVGAAAGTNSLLVVNATTGATIDTDNTLTAIDEVVCHSDDTEQRAYLREPSSANVSKWDNTPAVGTLLTAPAVVQGIAATPYGLLVMYEPAAPDFFVAAYNRAGTLLGVVTQDTSGNGVFGTLISDGVQAYAVESVTAAGALAFNGSTRPGVSSSTAQWTSALTGEAGVKSVDDRNVYFATVTGVYAINKATGTVAFFITTGVVAGAIVSDGRFLWSNVQALGGSANPNYLTAFPIQRNPGFWLRADAPDGSTGTFTSRPQPFMRLAIPE